MHGISLFSMTFMEITAFIIVWGSMNNYLNYKNVIKFISYIVLISAITTCADYFQFQFSGITIYMLMYFILLVLFKEPIRQAIAIYLFAIIICFSIQFGIFLAMKYMNLISNNIETLTNAFKVNCILIGINILLIYRFPLHKIKLFISNEINKISFILINIILFILIFKTAWDFDKHFILSHSIILLIILISLLITNYSFIKTTIDKNEQMKISQIQNSYNPIIAELVANVKRKQHDHNNHLNTIYGIIQTQDEASIKNSIKEYLNSLTSSFKDIDTLISLDNKILSAIIYSKLCFANENDIDFKFIINKGNIGYSLKDYQLSEVLNNLLDNAFEAVKDSYEKIVTLNIGFEEGRSFIEVRNNGNLIDSSDINKIFEKGYTSKKENKQDHGFGLYNIKKIIEAVKGEIHLFYEDGFLTFKIIL